jgi:formylglycine-generating enzyme required for sulfatase activity
VRARAVSRGARLWRWARRNPLVSALAAALVLVGIGGGAAIVLKNAELAASLAGLRRMSDVRLVEQYVGNRLDLRGHDPGHAAQLDAWLEVARGLAARRPLHEARLAALRATALPYDDRDRAGERERHPMAGHLESLHAEVAALPDRIEAAPEDRRADLARRLAGTRRRILEIEADLAVRRTWRFAGSAEQWEHDTLVHLLGLLDDLTDPVKGSLPAVERWRKFVGEVRRRTIEEPRALWERTIAGIADPALSPHYRGLEITPQLGLLPLGPDPDSRLHEFAHVLSGTPPDRDAEGRLRVTAETCIVLVLLPGGPARLGSRPPGGPGSEGPHVDPWSTDKEWPVHEVDLAPFFAGKFEVTAGQLRRATGLVRSAIGQSRFPEREDLEVDLLPVETITHVEAEGALAAIGLRLPTEAQWEHAARGGTASPWYPGDDPHALAAHGNVADRRRLRFDNRRPGDGHPGWALDDGWALVAPVGSYAHNPFGLHDVIGNVAELVLDSPVVYAVAGREGDGLREGGDARFRMVRGGSFTALPAQCRSASRDQFPRDTRLTNTGMRAARPLDPR